MKQTKEECVITAAMNIILHAGNARNILRDAGKCIAEGKNLDAIAQQLEEARGSILLAHKAQTVCLYCAITAPVLIYAMMLVAKVLSHRDENDKSDKGEKQS